MAAKCYPRQKWDNEDSILYKEMKRAVKCLKKSPGDWMIKAVMDTVLKELHRLCNTMWIRGAYRISD